jgi:hypothetical protein
MAEDLESDLVDLRINLERAEVGVRGGTWLLARLADASAPADSLHRALTSLQLCSFFIENAAEYLALRNSGRLGVISDADFRRRIVGLYEARLFLRELQDRDCQNTDDFWASLSPYVTSAPPSNVVGIGLGPDSLPDSARPRITGVPRRTALYSDPVVMNGLTTLVAFRAFLVSRIQSAIDDSERLRSDLLQRRDGSAE